MCATFSVTEGEDKPIKYTHMLREAGLVLPNKTGLLPHLDFAVEGAIANLRKVNAAAAEQITVPADYHGRRIELLGFFEKPVGPGPFPVVIVLHNCAGYEQNMYYGSLPGATADAHARVAEFLFKYLR